MEYRIVTDGPEVQVVVQAPTLPELFEQAVLAVFAITYRIPRVRVERDVPVMAVGDTPDELLGDWLQQVVAHARHHDLVLCSAVVDRLEVGGVQGAVGGFGRDQAVSLRFPPGTVVPAGPIVDVPDGHWVRLDLGAG